MISSSERSNWVIEGSKALNICSKTCTKLVCDGCLRLVFLILVSGKTSSKNLHILLRNYSTYLGSIWFLTTLFSYKELMGFEYDYNKDPLS